MRELTDVLETLLDEHRRIGSPMPDFLRPGIDPQRVRDAAAELGIVAVDELIELFAWHDGTDEAAYRASGWGLGYPRFFGIAFFAPFDQALGEYRDNVALDLELPDEPRWDPGWFPILLSERYGVDCGADSPTRGAVYRSRPAPHPIRFTSLTQMFELIVERFRAGAYEWDPSGPDLNHVTDVYFARVEAEVQLVRGKLADWQD